MKGVTALVLCMSLHALACTSSRAVEPLVGLWRLQQQELNGQQSGFGPLALQISQAGDKLTFAFSVPMPEIYFVTTTYTLRLDGSSADIIDGNGQKIGTIQMTRGGAGEYKLAMKGPNRPDGQGTLTVSVDGKTLISEADAGQSGSSVHSKQTFARSDGGVDRMLGQFPGLASEFRETWRRTSTTSSRTSSVGSRKFTRRGFTSYLDRQPNADGGTRWL